MAKDLEAERAEERLVLDLFRANGWRASTPPSLGPFAPAFLVKKGRLAYAVEVKAVSESRRDRMLPLLAQAILEVQAYSKRHVKGAAPLAIIVGRNISESLVKHLEDFAKSCAPNVAVGISDEASGLRRFHGSGLEELNAEPNLPRRRLVSPIAQRVYLFSDLNQWMLKVLLAPRIPEDLLSAPRVEYRNPSELAEGANVSSVSAYRFIHQLREEKYLDDDYPALRLVRLENLLHQWRAANLGPSKEIGMRWVLRGALQQKLLEALSAAGGQACLGVFAAAEALGLGLVRGVPPHLLLRRVDHDVLRDMGLASDLGGKAPDVVVRVPSAPESVFRAAIVRRGGIVASDVLQTWLDTSAHPSRGQEQADLIWRRVLQPALRDDVRPRR